MPFIDAKLTVPVDAAQKEALKTAFGKAIPTLHKTETYLMVGIQDSCDLWMAGQKLTKGAYVSVSLYGHASPADYNAMTGKICAIPSPTGAGTAAISDCFFTAAIPAGAFLNTGRSLRGFVCFSAHRQRKPPARFLRIGGLFWIVRSAAGDYSSFFLPLRLRAMTSATMATAATTRTTIRLTRGRLSLVWGIAAGFGVGVPQVPFSMASAMSG